MKNEKLAWLRFLAYFILFLTPLVTASSVRAESASLDTDISSEDKEKFDKILEPVVKIYNLIKYAASVIAVIAMLFAGINYMFSGNDMRKRDVSKNMAAYVLVGLVVIWGAPFVVNLLVA